MYRTHQILEHINSHELVIFRGTTFIDPASDRLLLSLIHRDGKLREDFASNYQAVRTIGDRNLIPVAAMPNLDTLSANAALNEALRLEVTAISLGLDHFTYIFVGRRSNAQMGRRLSWR